MRILIDSPAGEVSQALRRLDQYFSDSGFRIKNGIWVYSTKGNDFAVATIVRPVYNNSSLELEVRRPARIGCVHFGLNGDFSDADLLLFGIPSAVGYSCEFKEG